MEYFVANTFYEDYMELLISRVTHSTMSLERDLGDPDDSKNAIRLRDNMKAFKYLITHAEKQDKVTEELIVSVANLVNASSIYISDGYRKTGDYLAETSIPISNPINIRHDLLDLLDRYYNEWQDMDSFEREARFHIDFIRIHPFEDGNGRTARLFLNRNLMHQRISPVIITTDLEEFYNSYIKDNDYEAMANLFRIQSRKEYEVYQKLYNEYINQIEKVKK